MAPKFRGDSDDWLDEEDGPGKRRNPKSKKARSETLPFEQANATVAEVFPNQCRVRPDSPDPGLPAGFLCSYRRAEVMGAKEGEIRERSPVAVGDRVLARRTSPDAGVIEGVCARKNFLSRPAPGRKDNKIVHVLAANVDWLVIVASVARPEFLPGLVDRFLVAAGAAGIPALLCINKIDLAQNGDRPWEIYRTLGAVDVIEISARRGDGVSGLRERIKGKTAVFCGHSGVGKTSLLKELLQQEVGAVGEVSEVTGKGKHTTTGAVLLPGAEDSQWIDTPGIREFGLLNVTPAGLPAYFPEFRDLECTRRHGCLHETEADCTARSLPRHASYRRIMESLRETTLPEER